MRKPVVFALIVVFLSVSVSACLPAPSTIEIKCNTSDGVETWKSAGLDHEEGQQVYSFGTNFNRSRCEKVPGNETIDYAISTWQENWQGYVASGDLTVEPFHEERFAELKRKKYSAAGCRYREFERRGDWLITWDSMKSYCYVSDMGLCGSSSKNPVRHAGYILSHPSAGNFALLLPYLFGALILAAPVYVFARREGSRRFLKPNAFNIVFLLLSMPFVGYIVLLALVAGAFSWKWLVPLPVAYLTGSVIAYLYHKHV